MSPVSQAAVSSDAAISIRRLVKQYASGKTRALDGVDLDVHAGEVFGLLGPNGAGKTTTVGIATTRVKATAGEVRIAGLDVAKNPVKVKRAIGVVTQFNTLDRACTVFENLYFHCRYFGMRRAESKARAHNLLHDFRLHDRAAAMVATLSGGMAQRLQVARAIAHHPAVLFLDEPTAGLDPQSRLALWEIVGDLRAREGLTLLLTTHYIEEADQFCERVAIIDHGKVLVSDTPAALKRQVNAGTIIELALDDPPEDFLARLERLPAVRSADAIDKGARLMADTAGALLPRLVETTLGWGLSDVSITAPTLETVFISLTGRELRE